MSENPQDIFGKIDAILGKRAGFATGQPVASDEFPMLTEIVESVEPAKVASRAEDAMTSAVTEPQADLPADLPDDARPASGDAGMNELELDRLAAALEARLSELFIRQQMRIEALVRRVVREELERHDGARN